MKQLILISLIIFLLPLLVGCTPNDIDAEIKDMVKDMPIPPMYDRLTGEPLAFDKIVVKETTRGAPYDTDTGKGRRTYRVRVHYKGYFWQDYRYRSLALRIPDEPPSIWDEYKADLTMDEIKNNLDKLYWD